MPTHENSTSDFWRDRPTVVTGPTGLVGGHLVRELVHRRADVVCLVRDWTPASQFFAEGLPDRVRIVWGDVTDERLLARVLGEYEIRSVFHLAAQAIVGVANAHPVSTWDTNIRGTWTVLEACRGAPAVETVVIASSDKAYGARHDLPYTESTSLDPVHPYDVSKACADLIARSYARTFSTPVVTTRCGNFFGPGDQNWNRIVPGTIRSVLRDQRPVVRSDGRFIRDYFFVLDGVTAYLQLAEQFAAHPDWAGQSFNFSIEQPLTVLQLVQTLMDVMGSSLEPLILNRHVHEIPHQYLSAAKARDVLGWQPRFTLEEGLRLTVEWYRRFFAEESTCRTFPNLAGLAARSA